MMATERIREIEVKLKSCMICMMHSADDPTINAIIITLDELMFECPRLYNQLLGQTVVRAFIDAVEDEFDHRDEERSARHA